MKEIIFCFFTVLCAHYSFGQKDAKREIDSLNNLCYELFEKDPQKSLKLAKQAYEMAEEIGYGYGKSDALTYAAHCYYVNYSDYDTALDLYKRVIKFDSIQGHMDDVLVDYAGLASMYRTKGDFEKAIKYNLKAISIARENNYTIYEQTVLANTGNVYSEILDSVNAEISYLAALNLLSPTEKDDKMKAQLYSALSALYLNFPGLIDDTEEDKTFEYLTFAKKIAQELGDLYMESEADSFFRKYYLNKKDYDRALKYGIASVQNAHIIQRLHEEALNILGVGEVYLEMGQTNNALKEVLAGNAMCEKNGFSRNHIEGLTLLARIYMQQGNIDLAYETLEKRFALNDSIIGLTVTSKVTEAALNHELIQEQNKSLQLQNDILEKEARERNMMNWIVGLGILFISGIVIVFFVSRLRKAKRELLQSEIEQKAIQDQLEISALEVALLSAQMKPHFTFNVLNSIQYLIVSKQTDEAIKYLSEFAKFLRRILEYSNRPIIPMTEEMDVVESYLKLEKLRYKEKLTYTLELSEELNMEKLQVPSLSLQPFIENSIIHGFNHDGDGHILVKVSAISNSVVEILIQDNGIKSQETSTDNPAKRKSLGIELTKQRLANLDERNIVELSENEGGTGFSVNIKLHMS